MTCLELIASCKGRMEQLDARARGAFERMEDERMNAAIPPSSWSPAQILVHLMKANEPYLRVLGAVIDAAPQGESEVKFSRVGQFLIKVGGPGGNVPAPKQMIPPADRHPRTILDDYLAQTAELRVMFGRAEGKDINQARLNNPFVPIFRMTVADVFEVATQHTERHIGQIEASLRG